MLVLLVAVLCDGLQSAVCPTAMAGTEPDFLMDSDPQLDVPNSVGNFNPALKKLWMSALERPEADMQRMAAETIARAHQHGIPELIETVPALENIVVANTSHPAARFAACRTLIVLESRSSAETLFSASKAYGADLRQLIEPALAKWEYQPARAIWIARLEAADTKRRDLMLAIRGLGHVRETTVTPKLLAFANDLTRDSDVRLEAAIAVGQINDSGLEDEAIKLSHDRRSPYFASQLCAIRFLARHTSDSAKQLLVELAQHSEPVVASSSLSRLNEIDSALVLPLADSAMKNRDPNVRMQGASAALKLATADRIDQLCPLLADPNPSVRKAISVGLLELSAKSEFHDSVCNGAMIVLNGEGLQIEAAMLLGKLGYKPAATRLVELLESPRPEVMVAAAWALRKLAVAETIPAMIDKATRQTEGRRQGEVTEVDEQVAHLFEALGVLQAKDAMPLLLQYVSKDFYQGDRSRGAAIWAIGRLMLGNRDSDLEDQLSERISDFADRQPETSRVKAMCAIALAQMKADDQAEFLKSMLPRTLRPIELSVAMRWAVLELTGEELPAPDAPSLDQGNWFLEPIP